MMNNNSHFDNHQQEQQRQFEQKLVTKNKKHLRKIRQMEGKLTGRWNLEEHVKYYVFLVVNQKNFEEKALGKNNRIFKSMSTFIASRTPDQCRSHHQKIENKWFNFGNIIHNLSEQFGGIDIQQIFQQYGTLIIPLIKTSKNQDNQQTHQNSQILKTPSKQYQKHRQSFNYEIEVQNDFLILQPQVVNLTEISQLFSDEDIFNEVSDQITDVCYYQF